MHPAYRELLSSFDLQLPRIESCLAKLDDAQVWTRPLPAMNSIGNLCLHLAGNVSHYVGACIGKSGYVRDRSGEFDANGGSTRGELLDKLRDAVATARRVTETLGPDDLEREIDSNYPPDATVIGILVHVSTHFAYHTGQILVLTKLLTTDDARILEWGH